MTDTSRPHDDMPGEAITECPAAGDLLWVSAYRRWRPGRVLHLAACYGQTLPVVEYTRPNGKTSVNTRKLWAIRRRTPDPA